MAAARQRPVDARAGAARGGDELASDKVFARAAENAGIGAVDERNREVGLAADDDVGLRFDDVVLQADVALELRGAAAEKRHGACEARGFFRVLCRPHAQAARELGRVQQGRPR